MTVTVTPGTVTGIMITYPAGTAGDSDSGSDCDHRAPAWAGARAYSESDTGRQRT